MLGLVSQLLKWGSELVQSSASEDNASLRFGSSESTLLVCAAGNVYGVIAKFDKNGWLKASIFLMVVHQSIAYALYFLPLSFMSEKLFRVHTKPMYLRSLARIPVSLLVWLVSTAFPFYGTINSLIGELPPPGPCQVLCLCVLGVVSAVADCTRCRCTACRHASRSAYLPPSVVP